MVCRFHRRRRQVRRAVLPAHTSAMGTISKSPWRSMKAATCAPFSCRQHGARDVNEPASRFHQGGGLIQNLALLLLALCKRGGLQAPFGIRTPAPRAGARARRIDKDRLETRPQGVKRCFVASAQDLYVAHARALDALENRLQAVTVFIVGVDLSLVLHGRRHRERLAAAARAQVEHLLARTRA